MKAEVKQGRRTLVMAGACAMAAAVVLPAVVFVAAPARGGPASNGRWVRTVKLERLNEGKPARVAVVSDRHDGFTVESDVELGSVWLVRKGERVTAFSAVCPHLGCSVNAINGGFTCPCHTSSFDASGARLAGPAPRGLDALETRIEEGFVAVDFRRFRIGMSEKVES